MASANVPKAFGYEVLYPLISFMMTSGMWWILPQLAMTSQVAYSSMKEGVWTHASRTAFKVKGAVTMFKHVVEQKRVKKHFVDFLVMVLSPRALARKTTMENMGCVLTRTSKCGVWSEQLKLALKIDSVTNLAWKHLMLNMLQLGVILVHLGYQDTLTFTLFEVHVDLFIRRVHPKSTLQFRKVIQSIMGHDLNFCFLYTFDRRTTAFNIIPEYKQFMCTFCKMKSGDRMRFIETLPNCIRLMVPYLCFVLQIRKYNRFTVGRISEILEGYYGSTL